MRFVVRPLRLLHWLLIALLLAGTVGTPRSALAVSSAPANVTIKASPATLVADGSTLATISGTVTDALYNPISGVAVAVSTSDATVMIVQNTSVTTDVNGTYTTVLQATSKAGSANICATVPGTTISTCMTVQSTAPAPAISLNPTSVWAGGAVTVSGTNTHFAAGNTVVDVIAGSGTVAQTLSGTVASPTSLSFNTSASLSTGTYTVRVTTGSEVVSASLSVTQSTPAAITLTAAAAKVSTQYTGAVGLSGTVVDAQGRPVPGVGVHLSEDSSLIGLTSTAATTGSDGSYTSSFIVSSPAAGSTKICANVQGTTISVCTTVQTILVGPTAHVTISPAASSVLAGSSVALSGMATDAIGNPVAGGSFTLSASAGTITPATVTAQVDGSYTATFTAPDTPGAVTITAANGNGTVGTASILVTTPGASISLNPSGVTAGGTVAVSGTGTHFVGGTTVVDVIAGSGMVVQTLSPTVTNPTSLSFTTAPGLVSGSYVVRVTTGTEVAFANLSVTQTSGPALVRLDSSWTVDSGYPGTVALRGTVTNQEGSPVPGVVVDLTTDDVNRIRLGATPVTTGTDGSFSSSFTVTFQPPGSANICAAVSGTSVKMCKAVTVVVAGALAQATIQGVMPIVPPSTPVSISGLATDGAGNPVSGAQFTLSASGGSVTPASVTAAPDGSYTATFTTPGTPGIATVQAISGSLTLGTAAMVVAPSTGAMIGPSLGNATAGQMFTITGSNTHFVQGTTVVDVITNGGAILQTAPATVSGPTALSFTPNAGLGTGNYLVRITTGSEVVAGWLTVTQVNGATAIHIIPAAATISAQYWNPVGLTGTVVNAQGNPVPGVAVDLAVNGLGVPIKLGATSVTTGQDGSYASSFTLTSAQTGSATICASVHGTSISDCTTVQAVVIGVPYKVTITPAAAGVLGGGTVALSGRVTDANGQGVSGGGFALSASAGSVTPATVTAAADGSYTATFTAPAAPGTVTITASNGNSTLGTASILVQAPGPAISVNPASVAAGNTVSVIGTDTHFYAGSTVVDVIASNGTVVQHELPIITSATLLNFVTAPGLLTDTYTVQVTTGSEVVAASLSVTQASGPASISIGADASTVSTGYAGTVGLSGRVLDAQLNPVPGLIVDLTASTGVVKLGATSVTTGLDGTYAGNFTVTGATGSADICATVPGRSVTQCTTITTVLTAAPAYVSMLNNWPSVIFPGQSLSIWGFVTDGNHTISGGQFALSATGGSITPTSVTADASGRYTATFTAGNSQGIAIIRAQSGANTLGTAVLIVGNSPGDISLNPSTNVVAGDTITVFGQRSNFVAGSSMVDLISAASGAIVQSVQGTVASGTSLSFKLDPGLPTGSYLVRITTGTEVEAASLNVTQAHGAASITLVPAANGIFLQYAGPVGMTGTVKDAQGNPVPGLTVGLTTDSPWLIKLGTTPVTTGTDGSYASSFNLVPSVNTNSGKICATVLGTTITTCATINTILVGVAYKVTITPSSTSVPVGGTVTLSGVLTDPNGTPIAGGGFGLTASAGTITPTTVTAAADGSYTATFTAPNAAGSVTITATGGGGTLGTTSINVTVPAPSISLNPTSVVAGNMVSITGTGTHFAPGTTVDVISAGGTVVQTLSFPVSGTAFSFLVAPGLLTGDYTVRVTTGTEVVSASLHVTQTSGPTLVRLNATWRIAAGYAGTVPLTGWVTNQEVSPVPGVAVDLKTDNAALIHLGATSATTGTDGSFSIGFTVANQVGSGQICATVQGTSAQTCQTIQTVTPGELTQVSILSTDGPLVPPGSPVSIFGMATDRTGAPAAGAQFTLTTTDGSNTPTTVTTGPDGSYTAQLPAPSAPGILTVQARAGSALLGTAPLVVANPSGTITTGAYMVGAGQTVTINGTNTHFVQDTTVVDLISNSGVIVQTVTGKVSSPTALSFTTDATLPTSLYLVRVTTGSEVAATVVMLLQVQGAASITLTPVATTISAVYPGTVGLKGTVLNGQGSPVPGGVGITVTTDSPSFINLRRDAPATRADGSYVSSFTLPADGILRSGKICATVTGTPITACTTIQTIVVGVPYKATLTPTSASVPAGGTVTLSGVLTDPLGQPIAGGGFALSASAGSIAPATVTAAADGSYTTTFTAPNTAGVVTIRAANSNGTLGTANITVLPVVSAGQSTVTSGSTGWVVADGASTMTIMVVLRDAGNTPVPGRTVVLQSSSSTSTVTPGSAVTDGGGQATFTVKDIVPETVAYTAVDTTDSLTVTQTASVTYYIPQPVSFPPTPTPNPTPQGGNGGTGGSGPTVTTNPDGTRSIALLSNADKAQTDVTTDASLKIGVGGGAAQLQLERGTLDSADHGSQGANASPARAHVSVQLSLLPLANLPGVSGSTSPGGSSGSGTSPAAQPLAPSWQPQVAVEILAVPQNDGAGSGGALHQLAKPVTIRFAVPPATLAAAKTVVVAYYNPDLGIWMQLPTQVDAATGQVSTTVSHFTTFAVLTSGAATSTLTQMPSGAVTTPIASVSGTGKAGTTIAVYDNGLMVQSLKLAGDYSWSLPVSLQPGANALTVVSSETGGRVGLGESTVTYNAPVTAPLPAPVPAPGAGAGSNVGKTPAGAAGTAVVLWDLGGYDWARPAIVDLVAKGIMSGYTGVFHPQYVVTRAEFVDALVKALHLTGSAPLAFRDADEIPELLRDGVATAVANGLLKGLPDGTLRPRAVLSRAEAAVLLSRALQLAPVAAAVSHVAYADRDQLPAWALDGIGQASAAGLMRGYADGGFHPDDNLTRAQVAVLIERYLQKRE